MSVDTIFVICWIMFQCWHLFPDSPLYLMNCVGEQRITFDELDYTMSVSGIGKVFADPTYLLPLSFMGHLRCYKSFITNEIAFTITKCCPIWWISGLLRSFEFHWVGQYLVNVTDLAGIVNTIVYKTKPFFFHRSQVFGVRDYLNRLHCIITLMIYTMYIYFPGVTQSEFLFYCPQRNLAEWRHWRTLWYPKLWSSESISKGQKGGWYYIVY